MKKFQSVMGIVLTTVIVASSTVVVTSATTINDKHKEKISAVKVLDGVQAPSHEEVQTLTVCELVRLLVIQIAGEQPMIMDTHYAMPYMEKAESLGIIKPTQYPMEKWNQKISQGEIKHILKNVASLDLGVDVEVLLSQINSHQVKEIRINGKSLKSSQVEVRNGHVMVPLRPVAERLQLNLEWENKTYKGTLYDDTMRTTIQIGSDHYYKAGPKGIGTDPAQSLGVAPMLINGQTYVPVAFFGLLFDSPDSIYVENNILEMNL